MASAATRSLLTAPVTRNMSSSPFTVAVCTIVSQAWNVLAMVICLIFFCVFFLQKIHGGSIMGKHEEPVASVPVTLLPVTKRVSLTNYVAALPLLHSVIEGRY